MTFVIPVRNDAAALMRCIRSIQQSQDGAPVRLVVIDNGSTDDSIATARSMGATVLELPGLKVGELRNRGAAAVSDDVVAFVDSDHEIGRGWIDAAMETLGQPGVGAVGAPYSPPKSATWVQRIYNAFRRHTSGIREVEWLGSGNLAVRAEAFATIGGFDTTLEACEDVDLCRRLKHAGYRVMSDARLRSVHYGDPASLRVLFLSELWRGRDNVRVSLRPPVSLRDLPSVIVPAVDLACLIVMAIGMAMRLAYLALLGPAVFFGLAALRSIELYRRVPDRSPADRVRTFVVAAVYDLGRALALVARAPHRRARRNQQAVS